MAKRKRTKKKTMVHKILYRILKIEPHDPHWKTVCSRRVNSSCSTSGTHHVTLVMKEQLLIGYQSFIMTFRIGNSYDLILKMRKMHSMTSKDHSCEVLIQTLNGSWIYNYLCNQCLSSIKFIARCTTLCDLPQVSGFLQFPPPIKLTTMI
jgi:hypothetical protein